MGISQPPALPTFGEGRDVAIQLAYDRFAHYRFDDDGWEVDREVVDQAVDLAEEVLLDEEGPDVVGTALAEYSIETVAFSAMIRSATSSAVDSEIIRKIIETIKEVIDGPGKKRLTP